MTRTQSDLEELVASLTLEEKALLTAGEDLFSTPAVERAGLPKVRLTDGPNGARGAFVPGGDSITAACVPCGAALGATWNVELVERVGSMLGEEARTKACRVLLAPTVNLHRSPLAGRNFECYSEDPLLTGKLAAAFVRGVQSQDVATTVKHFVGNDAEFERHTINSVIDERTLRELYLVPFELAVREGGALGVMTAYNRCNGPYVTENVELLQVILRSEWDFNGFVLTDWFGQGSTVGASAAGLDLEMPGPGRFYGPALVDAIKAGDVDEATLDAQLIRLLTVYDRVGALDDPPDVAPQSVDREEHRALAREAATEAIVLLANDGMLPLELDGVESVAIVGPNAEATQIMGGGSASFEPHRRVSVLDALRERLGDDVTLRHERGCEITRTVPPLRAPALTTPDGEPGLAVEYFAGRGWEGDAVHTGRAAAARHFLLGRFSAEVPEEFSLRATGRFTPDETGAHTFTLSQAGRARVLVDGEVVLDGFDDPPPHGKEFFGLGSEEVEAAVELTAGEPVDVVIEYANEHTPAGVGGVKVGCKRPELPDLLDRAVTAAAESDLAIVVVGTNDDWESEGHDRTTLTLPGEQDELVRRVVAANPNTVVVLNTGAPVTINWPDGPRALLQAWFGGQELGHAVVDVLTGEAEPGGRLPTTYPVRLEDSPSFGNFPGEFGEVRYGEGVLMGYRGFEARRTPVRFPFGHGLSYTTFEIGAPTLSRAEGGGAGEVTLTVPVSNTGSRRGSEVVQCYVAPPAGNVVRPPQELKAFAKVHLDPGEETTVTFTLDQRALAIWDPVAHGWRVDAGRYDLRVGRSSKEIAQRVAIDVEGRPAR